MTPGEAAFGLAVELDRVMQDAGAALARLLAEASPEEAVTTRAMLGTARLRLDRALLLAAAATAPRGNVVSLAAGRGARPARRPAGAP